MTRNANKHVYVARMFVRKLLDNVYKSCLRVYMCKYKSKINNIT